MSKQRRKSKIKRRAAERHAPRLREVTEHHPAGIEVTHRRTVDTLGLLLDSGTIMPGMHAAARDFQAAFTIACFDRMPRVNLIYPLNIGSMPTMLRLSHRGEV